MRRLCRPSYLPNRQLRKIEIFDVKYTPGYLPNRQLRN